MSTVKAYAIVIFLWMLFVICSTSDFVKSSLQRRRALRTERRHGLAVPLIAPLRLLLGVWRAKSRRSVWVFPTGKGTTAMGLNPHLREIRAKLQAAGVPWKGLHAGRRGLGTMLRTLTGNSNAGRDVLGHATTQVTEQHYEAVMPAEALNGMKLLEDKVTRG